MPLSTREVASSSCTFSEGENHAVAVSRILGAGSDAKHEAAAGFTMALAQPARPNEIEVQPQHTADLIATF